jgi:glycosyltransferase involved in cell wall biosynthesis
MQKLSVVIITFNEAKNIERCLLSVRAVADEIIVYDSFSIDNTCKIAEKYGAKVFQEKWQGYAISKNEANKKTSNDWILSLDADEVLSEELQNDILALKVNGLKTASFKRLTNYCGTWIRHAGWYPDIKLRLFNKHQMQWEGLIHEELKAIMNESIIPVLLSGDCLHYSYYTIEEHIKQSEKFSALSAQNLFQKGEKSNFIKLYFAPIFKFIKMYFIKLGILDGYYGYVVCKISAKAIYLRNLKLLKLYASK